MKRITKLTLAVLMSLMASTAMAGDSGGPLAIRPQRQEQKQPKYDDARIPGSTDKSKYDDAKAPSSTDESKHDGSDAIRPQVYKQQAIVLESQFVTDLADALVEDLGESKVILHFDESTGDVEVKIERDGESKVIYQDGEWL